MAHKQKAVVFVEDRGDDGPGFFAKAMVERNYFNDYYGPFHLKNGRIWDTPELAKAFLDKYAASNLKAYDVIYAGVMTDAESWQLRKELTKELRGAEQQTLFE